jgi:hypothetical protein
MTLTGSEYLLQLSVLAVSFVGFTMLVVALRVALGAELSELHMHFVRLFIEGGLAVAACGLLPAALSTTGLADSTIWRLSSAPAALTFSAYMIFLFRRLRRVAPGRVSLRRSVNFVISIMAALALWVNTVGFRFQPNAAPYALALTWFLVLGGWVFLQNLELFFGKTPSR